jgi:hypothetical protein
MSFLLHVEIAKLYSMLRKHSYVDDAQLLSNDILK